MPQIPTFSGQQPVASRKAPVLDNTKPLSYDAIAQGVSSIGDSIYQIGVEERNRADAAIVTDANNTYMYKRMELDRDFQQLKGMDAVKGEMEYQKKLKDIQTEISQGLPDRRQRDAFMQSSQGTLRSGAEAARSYASGQRAWYERTVAESGEQLADAQVAKNAKVGMPADLIAKGIEDKRQAAINKLAVQGIRDPNNPVYKSAVQEATQKGHAITAELLLTQDADAATQYVKTHESAMDPVTVQTILEKAKIKHKHVAARTEAEAAYQQAQIDMRPGDARAKSAFLIDPAEGMAKIEASRKLTDENRAEARQRYSNSVSEYNASVKQASMDYTDSIMADPKAIPDHSRMTPADQLRYKNYKEVEATRAAAVAGQISEELSNKQKELNKANKDHSNSVKDAVSVTLASGGNRLTYNIIDVKTGKPVKEQGPNPDFLKGELIFPNGSSSEDFEKFNNSLISAGVQDADRKDILNMIAKNNGEFGSALQSAKEQFYAMTTGSEDDVKRQWDAVSAKLVPMLMPQPGLYKNPIAIQRLINNIKQGAAPPQSFLDEKRKTIDEGMKEIAELGMVASRKQMEKAYWNYENDPKVVADTSKMTNLEVEAYKKKYLREQVKTQKVQETTYSDFLGVTPRPPRFLQDLQDIGTYRP